MTARTIALALLSIPILGCGEKSSSSENSTSTGQANTSKTDPSTTPTEGTARTSRASPATAPQMARRKSAENQAQKYANEATEALVALLDDDDEQVVLRAVKAYSELRDAPETVRKRIRTMAVKGRSYEIRKAATLAIGALGDREGIAPLNAIVAGEHNLKHPWDSADVAITALMKLKSSESAVGILECMKKDNIGGHGRFKSQQFNVNAAQAIGYLGDESLWKDSLDYFLKQSFGKKHYGGLIRGVAMKAEEGDAGAVRFLKSRRELKTLIAAVGVAEVAYYREVLAQEISKRRAAPVARKDLFHYVPLMQLLISMLAREESAASVTLIRDALATMVDLDAYFAVRSWQDAGGTAEDAPELSRIIRSRSKQLQYTTDALYWLGDSSLLLKASVEVVVEKNVASEIERVRLEREKVFDEDFSVRNYSDYLVAFADLGFLLEYNHRKAQQSMKKGIRKVLRRSSDDYNIHKVATRALIPVAFYMASTDNWTDKQRPKKLYYDSLKLPNDTYYNTLVPLVGASLVRLYGPAEARSITRNAPLRLGYTARNIMNPALLFRPRRRLGKLQPKTDPLARIHEYLVQYRSTGGASFVRRSSVADSGFPRTKVYEKLRAELQKRERGGAENPFARPKDLTESAVKDALTNDNPAVRKLAISCFVERALNARIKQ